MYKSNKNTQLETCRLTQEQELRVVSHSRSSLSEGCAISMGKRQLRLAVGDSK